ncbi:MULTISPECIES: ABC transporter substrate-binding protein [Brevibacillus]|jgi:ABC-type Fe3+-hydroxamate transport system, periplasmic component|uniref:ABC transporter substrate-binding protein n=1 Tax=Brevibacillus TaxID=55080 RepID=UPI00156AE237|nr:MULTISPECIES: ABC transporter substrate-binding protein [Brevibacillus]UED69114.1 ABC transporter substrate-binding protein [Brevibacillus sp. HD3.3A]
MHRGSKAFVLLSTFALMGGLLLGCGNNEAKESQSASPSPVAETAKASAATTRMFTDWAKHEVEVPVTPQRVIYHGETTGDLLALGVEPIGIMKQAIEGTVLEDRLPSAQDVGFPLNVEKALTLNPDLIIFSNSDTQQYEAISKVAPTVTFNTFDTLEVRMRTLGDLLNKKQEAEEWLAAYTVKAADMWANLRANGIQEGETASVFTMYPGNRLFVMAGAGLPQFLYEKGGFKPLPIVQELIDQQTGFIEISTELLPKYAADRIFILNPVDSAAQDSTKELRASEVWLNLPAVKSGKVYDFDILKANSDATSREWMITELPKVLLNQKGNH